MGSEEGIGFVGCLGSGKRIVFTWFLSFPPPPPPPPLLLLLSFCLPLPLMRCQRKDEVAHPLTLEVLAAEFHVDQQHDLGWKGPQRGCGRTHLPSSLLCPGLIWTQVGSPGSAGVLTHLEGADAPATGPGVCTRSLPGAWLLAWIQGHRGSGRQPQARLTVGSANAGFPSPAPVA